MLDLTQAVYDVMAGDPTLVGLLADYHGSPAIFTQDTIPEDAEPPFVVTVGNIVNDPLDTKNTRARDTLRQIDVYSNEGDKSDVQERPSKRIRELFHRLPFPVPGGTTTMLVNVFGPTPSAAGPKLVGRTLLLRTWVNEPDP